MQQSTPHSVNGYSGQVEEILELVQIHVFDLDTLKVHIGNCSKYRKPTQTDEAAKRQLVSARPYHCNIASDFLELEQNRL